MFPDRYNIENLKKLIRNPSVLRREVERASFWLNKRYFRYQYGDGVDIMNKEWDTLVILDACRYDYFTEQNTIEGELRAVTSRGSQSWEFMQANFVNRDLHDTVYVTANPYVERLSQDVFYTVDNLVEKWDPDLGTILPSEVTDAALQAADKYPNKRLIVHYMQPHDPWLGPTADEIRDRVDVVGFHKYEAHDSNIPRDGINYPTALNEGYFTVDEMKQAYRETLDIVLNHVADLLAEIDGKSVITADHGELLGERIAPLTEQEYFHPSETYTPELRVVPWLETQSGDRRKIHSEEPIGFDKLGDDVVSDRLEALGYKSE